MAKSKISLKELSQRVGISMTNLSLLKTGKVKAIRFTTLAAICKELNCQPGDILEYIAEKSVVQEAVINAPKADQQEPNS